MKKFFPIITLLFQIIITSIVLFIIYIIYALTDRDDADMANGIGFLLFQPLYGFILTVVTVLACLLVGLPIRLIRSLKQWWYRKPAVPLFGVAIGLLLLSFAFYPAWRETQNVIIDGTPSLKLVPNIAMALIGWFITGFSLLHFYPQSLLYFFRSKTIVSL